MDLISWGALGFGEYVSRCPRTFDNIYNTKFYSFSLVIMSIIYVYPDFIRT